MVEARARPRGTDDIEELPRAGVPLVVPQHVSVAALLGVTAAGHDVEQQPAFGHPLEGRRHLCGQGRLDQARTERDQELQPPGLRDQGRSDNPCVLAMRPGRSENALVPERVGGTRELSEVVQRRRTLPAGMPLAGTGGALLAGAGRADPQPVH